MRNVTRELRNVTQISQIPQILLTGTRRDCDKVAKICEIKNL